MNVKRMLVVGVLLCSAVPLAAGATESFDRYQCFKVRSVTTATDTADLHVTTVTHAADGTATTRDCQLDAAHRLLCVAAQRELLHVERADGATAEPVVLEAREGFEDQLCYRASCTGPVVSTLQVADAFGVRRLTALGDEIVCTPVLPVDDAR